VFTLIRNYGNASALFACPSALNSSVQGQQVDLAGEGIHADRGFPA
jgi:hypothetical protein